MQYSILCYAVKYYHIPCQYTKAYYHIHYSNIYCVIMLSSFRDLGVWGLQALARSFGNPGLVKRRLGPAFCNSQVLSYHGMP